MKRPIVAKSLIGSRSEKQTIRVETGQLKFFAKATDQRDPVYFDVDAAVAQGYRGIPVPLTFAFSLAIAFPDQAGFGLIRVGADPRFVLHAEQGFRNHAMIFCGDDITLQTGIQDIYEKKGGALLFVVQRTELSNQAGQLCIDCNTTFVIRMPKA